MSLKLNQKLITYKTTALEQKKETSHACTRKNAPVHNILFRLNHV